MYIAIIASVVAIGAALYMEGPIVALALTALTSLSLLIALRYSERKSAGRKKQAAAKLGVVAGSGDADLHLPPLRQRAS